MTTPLQNDEEQLDLDLDLEDEENQHAQQASTEEEVPAEQTAEQKRIAELESERDSWRSSTSKSDDKMGELLEMGKQFLAKQNAPVPASVNKDELKALGKRIQDTVISGEPEDVVNMFTALAQHVSSNTVNSTLNQFGGPIAERAADFAVQAFLSQKGDDLGPNAEKTHGVVRREFKLDDAERTWLGTANAKDSRSFLERKYMEAAGNILMRSSQRARPKNLDASSGGGSGKGGGGNLPGLDAKQSKRMNDLAALLWSDDKTRESKMKQVGESMKSELNNE